MFLHQKQISKHDFSSKTIIDSPFACQGGFCVWFPPLALLDVQVGRIQSLSEFRPLAVKGWGPCGHWGTQQQTIPDISIFAEAKFTRVYHPQMVAVWHWVAHSTYVFPRKTVDSRSGLMVQQYSSLVAQKNIWSVFTIGTSNPIWLEHAAVFVQTCPRWHIWCPATATTFCPWRPGIWRWLPIKSPNPWNEGRKLSLGNCLNIGFSIF